MADEQATLFSDSEVLRSAARLMDSLRGEILESNPAREKFAFKSAASLELVAHTLRRWAEMLEDTAAADRLIANETILKIERPADA